MAASLGRMPQERTTANRADASTDTTGVALPNEPAPRNRLLDSLEPGPLRDELMRGEAPASTRAAVVEPNVPAVAHRLRFTGDGREYFRIWIVNLLLTLGTFGVYGAWAKVRKLRYFRQNTLLDGHAFDFHARPLPMLFGASRRSCCSSPTSSQSTCRSSHARRHGAARRARPVAAPAGSPLPAAQYELARLALRVRGTNVGCVPGRAAAFGRLFAGVLLTQALGRTPRTGTWTSLVGLAFPWIHHRLRRSSTGTRRTAIAGSTSRQPSARSYAIYLLAGSSVLRPRRSRCSSRRRSSRRSPASRWTRPASCSGRSCHRRCRCGECGRHPRLHRCPIAEARVGTDEPRRGELRHRDRGVAADPPVREERVPHVGDRGFLLAVCRGGGRSVPDRGVQRRRAGIAVGPGGEYLVLRQ